MASVHTTNIFSALVQAWLVLVQPGAGAGLFSLWLAAGGAELGK